jgi:hypothetical protein
MTGGVCIRDVDSDRRLLDPYKASAMVPIVLGRRFLCPGVIGASKPREVILTFS